MTTARKQAKAKNREKKNRAKEHNIKQREHDQARQRRANAAKGRDEALLSNVAREGIAETARRLKAEGQVSGASKRMTNLGIVQIINKMIPVFSIMHGSIEIISRLVQEGKIELTPDNIDFIAAMDRNVVRLNENINLIYDMIDLKRQPDDYFDVYIDYVDTMAEFCADQVPALHADFLDPYRAIMDEYTAQHRGELNIEEFSAKLHEARMLRVAPLYATKAKEIEDMTKPFDGELVDPDDYYADDAVDMAREINPSAPTMKD